ncbi:hypothetical protein LguiA_016222 [Lonicera macranthoides]
MLVAMTMTSAVSDRARAMWRTQLGSALRTVLACTIVGCATLYGPAPIRTEIPFPAFSYVTAILIVSDATLGDTLRGCWHAFIATVQVVPVSMLCLWVIGPGKLSLAFAAMAVAAGAFLVALPESTVLMTKRIGFGQLVIVYVGAVMHGDRAGYAYIHPLHIASSTLLGALASVLAMLLPYPRLAIYQVRKLFQLYNENASERATLLMKAFLAQDNETAIDLLSQAKPFAETGAKLLRSIKLMQLLEDGVLWERPRLRKSRHNFMNPGDRLLEMETPIRGLEIAIASCPSFPISIIDEELRDVMLQLEAQLHLKLGQATSFMPSDAMTAPESKGELINAALESLNRLSTISPTQKDLPSFFFLSCLQLLLTDSTISRKIEIDNIEQNRETENKFSCKRIFSSLNVTPSNESLVFASKCSVSLGLAVLFGLIFNTENGYWSGLTIAISFVTGRQATLTFSNARAQGTAMGSVYGVVGYFVFRGLLEMRFLLLIPWIIFTSFLRHSRMYGQAGAVSAVIGALLILGRKKYGQPDEFAILRLAEATIGLCCLVVVELIVQPARAATLAKSQLSLSLRTLEECIKQIALCSGPKEKPGSVLLELREKQRKLKFHVNGLKNFINDAEMEPDFWFVPFHACSYNKLHRSLSNTVDLLHFMAYIMELLLQVSNGDIHDSVNKDLEFFKENISPSLKFLEKITSNKSLAVFLQEGKTFRDLESGKLSDADVATSEEAAKKILNSFIQHSNDVTNKIRADEGEEKIKVQMVLCLSSLGFCISGLMREVKAIEKGVKELVRRENPSSRIDFFEISSKIDIVSP